MLKSKRITWVTVLLAWGLLSVVAQAQATTPAHTPTPTLTPTFTPAPDVSCPQLVQEALDITQTNCEIVGRNKVCYGHSTLSAAWRPVPREIKFDEPGDIEEIIEMQSLSLSPMDFAQRVWGIILLEVQAGLSLAVQQNVTMVVFGDTRLNANNILLPAQVVSNTNLRDVPTIGGESVALATPQDALWVSGQLEDGSWVRVQFADDPERVGWLTATQIVLVDSAFTLEDVPIISPDDQDAVQLSSFGPMQAFYFESGKDDAPCEEAPNSGLMIQTPEGAAEVTLWIDEVIIELSGSASSFVQAQANGDLTINVLEGTVSVTAFGETQTAVSGTRIRVPLDQSLGALDVPAEPEAFDLADLQSLPTDLLPRGVEVPAPRTVLEGVPLAGNWRFAWGVNELSCPDGTRVPFESSGEPTGITVSDDGATLSWGAPYTRTGDRLYTLTRLDDNGNLIQETLTVTSSTSIRGEMQIDFAARICTLNVPFSLNFIR